MRLDRAIDNFGVYRTLELDAQAWPSYYRILVKLADRYPDADVADFDGKEGKAKVLALLGERWAGRSAATRANVVSVFHSFFEWLEAEDLIDDDRVRTIQRPKKKRVSVYRPGRAELLLGERVCTVRELAAWVLMARRGFRAATIVAIRWQNVDLARGRVEVELKGGHREWVTLGDAETVEILRDVYRRLQPEPEDHVFTVEEERWVDQENRVRRVKDPKTPRSTKALWRMVGRVCKRAGIRELGPHALRHGFATGFLRDSDRDVASLQGLLGHSRIDTTQHYTDELKLEELQTALDRAADRRAGVTPDDATSVADPDDEDPETIPEALDPAYGGGGNRTRVRSASSSDDERSRTREDDDPRLEPPTEAHK